MTRKNKNTVTVDPNNMPLLGRRKMSQLLNHSNDVYSLFRKCALAALCSGSKIDDATALFETYKDFDVQLVQKSRGIQLEITNAPESAFVDGNTITASSQHMLFSILRDIVFIDNEISQNRFDFKTSEGITEGVFEILNHARILRPGKQPGLVVAWGGHSIESAEYDYCKEVGYRLGLLLLNVITGCGPGVMRAAMKGAAVGHAKQRISHRARYVGMTEPGIIAAEPPNGIVNELVTLPDIEKRLEAFVRAGHGIVVFPGGAGTAEEVLYILGILLHPKNAHQPFPLIFTSPEESKDYFKRLDAFIGKWLGKEAQSRYTIVDNNPKKVAELMRDGIEEVFKFRSQTDDAYYYNWSLEIDEEFQWPFDPTHENMASLELHGNLPKHILAANIRRAFSGIVAGNVKPDYVKLVSEKPYELTGDPELIKDLSELLEDFAKQGRMKLEGEYKPCYVLK